MAQFLFLSNFRLPFGHLFVKSPITSPEIQAEWAKISGYFSPRLSVGKLLEDYVVENPKYSDALELLPYADFEPQFISYNEVRNAVQETFQAIINGDVEIETALAELDEQVAEIHAEATE